MPMTTVRHKGHFTFRTAAVLFLLSALLELAGLAMPVPLFGELHTGVVATVYHLVYAVLFVVLGAGLWTGKRWGYYAIFAGSALYTLDKLQFLASGKATEDFLRAQFHGQEELLRAVGPDMVMTSLTLVTLSFVVGWWVFAGYAYFRRIYFSG